MYLEDLRSQMIADIGVAVSCKLIWQTLKRNGLTMKKVHNTINTIIINTRKTTFYRHRVLQRSAQKSNELNMCFGCQPITQMTSWFLLTNHHLTATLRVENMHGQQTVKGLQRGLC